MKNDRAGLPDKFRLFDPIRVVGTILVIATMSVAWLNVPRQMISRIGNVLLWIGERDLYHLTAEFREPWGVAGESVFVSNPTPKKHSVRSCALGCEVLDGDYQGLRRVLVWTDYDPISVGIRQLAHVMEVETFWQVASPQLEITDSYGTPSGRRASIVPINVNFLHYSLDSLSFRIGRPVEVHSFCQPIENQESSLRNPGCLIRFIGNAVQQIGESSKGQGAGSSPSSCLAVEQLVPNPLAHIWFSLLVAVSALAGLCATPVFPYGSVHSKCLLVYFLKRFSKA